MLPADAAPMRTTTTISALHATAGLQHVHSTTAVRPSLAPPSTAGAQPLHHSTTTTTTVRPLPQPHAAGALQDRPTAAPHSQTWQSHRQTAQTPQVSSQRVMVAQLSCVDCCVNCAGINLSHTVSPHPSHALDPPPPSPPTHKHTCQAVCFKYQDIPHQPLSIACSSPPDAPPPLSPYRYQDIPHRLEGIGPEDAEFDGRVMTGAEERQADRLNAFAGERPNRAPLSNPCCSVLSRFPIPPLYI